jgi:hypothetical protein
LSREKRFQLLSNYSMYTSFALFVRYLLYYGFFISVNSLFFSSFSIKRKSNNLANKSNNTFSGIVKFTWLLLENRYFRPYFNQYDHRLEEWRSHRACSVVQNVILTNIWTTDIMSVGHIIFKTRFPFQL